MSDYIIKRNVPILDEHVVRDDDGEPLYNINAQKLHYIANRNNQRVKQTGDLCPVVIGHTDDDAKEEDQPEVVGYAWNYRVKPLGRTGRKAITATFKLHRKHLDKIRKYPRRSVELWFTDWKIDPIALLGATTPERDLGLLQLSKGGRRSYKRVFSPLRNQKEATVDPKEIAAAVIAQLKQTAEWKWLEEQAGAANEQAVADEQAPEDEGLLDEGIEQEGLDDGGEDDLGDEDIPMDEGVGEEDEEEEPQRYSAPSGSNTYTPGSKRMKCAARPAGARSVTTTQRRPAPSKARQESDRIRLSRVARKNEQLAKQLEGMRLKYQRAERERDLVQLEAEGVMLDREEELEDLMALPEQIYQRQLEKIRHRYQKAPIDAPDFGGRYAPRQRRNPLNGPTQSKDQMRQIAAYAQEHGLQYNEAAEQFNLDAV